MERGERPRIAGVSSFGFSGTNAHVIIEEAPAPSPTAAPAASDPPSFRVLPLSARTPAALGQTAASYRDWLSAHPEASLADVCLTAGAGRAHFERRAALVVNSLESARELLDALADDLPAPAWCAGLRRRTQDRVAVPRSGQSVRRHGPGVVRHRTGVRRNHAPLCGRHGRPDGSATARRRLGDPDDPAAVEALQQTRHAQPAIFAVEMGLARLWQSWGLAPDVVLGHSVGQYAAACVAGIFSLEKRGPSPRRTRSVFR